MAAKGRKPSAAAFTSYEVPLDCDHRAVFRGCSPCKGDLVFCRPCCDYRVVQDQDYSPRGWGARRSGDALPASPAAG